MLWRLIICPKLTFSLFTVISCPGKLRSVYRNDKRMTPQKENGAWVRDPYQETDRIYFMGYEPLETRQMWEFGTLNDLAQSGKPLTFYQMNDRVDGTGFVVYDRNMYFNIVSKSIQISFYRNFNIVLWSCRKELKKLPGLIYLRSKWNRRLSCTQPTITIHPRTLLISKPISIWPWMKMACGLFTPLKRILATLSLAGEIFFSVIN